MRTIRRNEYIQLAGLLALAKPHYAALVDIERAACAITGEEFNSGGHTGDAVWSGYQYDADELLRKLKITVEDETERT